MEGLSGSTDRAPRRLVEAAIERFSAGDDAGFLDCFAPDAVVWAEPQLAAGVILDGRDQLAAWCREARRRWSEISFAHGELREEGAGVYLELDVVTGARGGGGAWRLPLAVFVRDGVVVEVLPQADREAAIALLGSRR